MVLREADDGKELIGKAATMPRSAASVVLSVAGAALGLAALAAAILSAHTDPDRVLVLGVLGPGSLWELTWVVGGLAFVVVLVVGSWVATTGAHTVLRVGVRFIAGASAIVGVVALCLYGFYSMLGTTRYLDVGAIDGHDIVVRESSSLAGVSAEVGYREGWFVVPAHTSDPVAAPSVVSVDGGSPPSSESGYRVRRAGGTVIVTFSIAGENQTLHGELPR
jgi:hypothetical protein